MKEAQIIATRLLIAGYDARQQIIDISTRSSGYEVVGTAKDGQATIEMVMQTRPDAVLISYNLEGIPGPQLCEMLSAASPEVMLLLVTDQKTEARLELAMSSGARALLSMPLDPELFTAQMNRLAEIRSRKESEKFRKWLDPSNHPHVITVTGAKGGVGKTNLAVNLAIAMHRNNLERVAILDLGSPFCDVAALLNVTPLRSVQNLQVFAEELDQELVKFHMIECEQGVSLLPLSTTAVTYDSINVSAMESILFALKRMFKYIIIDLPPVLMTMHIKMMATCNLILMITEEDDIVTLANTKKFHDALVAEGMSPRDIYFVLNRVAKYRLHNIDIDHILDNKVIARIADDRQVPESRNNGAPLMVTEKSKPFVRSMNDLARWVIDRSNTVAGIK